MNETFTHYICIEIQTLTDQVTTHQTGLRHNHSKSFRPQLMVWFILVVVTYHKPERPPISAAFCDNSNSMWYLNIEMAQRWFVMTF